MRWNHLLLILSLVKGAKNNMSEKNENEKEFRSLILKYFPPELLIKLDQVSMTYGVDNNNKTPEILELLNQYKVPFEPLGNGTNRYGILIDGYAVKIALDRMGKTDNKREFKYAKRLYPYVVKVYECCETGLLAVFEYITIFSYSDYLKYQEQMREILKDITEEFLVGDIGISQNNYVNWGIRPDGTIAILDFAYIYSLSYRGFLCTCEDQGVLQYSNDFNYLRCPFCGKKWSFSDIRKRISKQDEIDEIGDIMRLGYVLTDMTQKLPIIPSESLSDKKKKKEKVFVKKEEKPKEISFDEQMESLDELDKMIYGGKKL